MTQTQFAFDGPVGHIDNIDIAIYGANGGGTGKSPDAGQGDSKGSNAANAGPAT